MITLVFFLEEQSAKVLLETVIPRVFPEVWCRFVVFQGKQDLEKRLMGKMRGYLDPQAKFVVLRDQDSGDCKVIKQNLVKKCHEAGHPESLVRIACHELESWFLADLKAVENGFQTTGLQKLQSKYKYKSPDDFPSPHITLSELVRSYQKINGARVIGPYLDIENRRSRSFAAFIGGLRKFINE